MIVFFKGKDIYYISRMAKRFLAFYMRKMTDRKHLRGGLIS